MYGASREGMVEEGGLERGIPCAVRMQINHGCRAVLMRFRLFVEQTSQDQFWLFVLRWVR